MIFRIDERPSHKWIEPNTKIERHRFLLLPKSIKHGGQHIVRWLEHAEWVEVSSYRWPNTAESERREMGYTKQIPKWTAARWLDIEEAAVEGLNKLNIVAENPVDRYPYK